jgi:hypothetical protein
LWRPPLGRRVPQIFCRPLDPYLSTASTLDAVDRISAFGQFTVSKKGPR